MSNIPTALHERKATRSLSQDMTISLILLIALVMLALFAAGYYFRSNDMRREIDATADEYVSNLADILAVPLWTFDENGIRQAGSVFAQNELVSSVRIADHRGRLLFELAKPDDGAKQVERERVIRFEDQKIGTARVTLTLAPYQRSLRLFSVTMVAAFGVVVVVLAVATGLFLRVFLARPFRELTEGMNRLADGRFSGEFKRPRHHEMDEIMRNFRAMAVRVQSREAALEAEVQEREKAEERYAVAVRGANDGIWDWDLYTDEVYYSPRWKEIIGFAEYEFPHDVEEWKKRIHPDDLEAVVNAHQNLMAGLTDEMNLEYRLRHKHGSYRWIHARGASLKDDSGEPVRIAGAITDVTLRKQAERQLRKSEEMYRSLIETTSEGYLMLDRDALIRGTNKAFRDMLGYSRIEIEGRTPMDFMDDQDGSIFANLLAQRGSSPHQQGEFTFRRREGDEVNVLASATTMFHANGEVKGCFVLFTDITERKRMENQLRHQAMHDPLTGLANRTLCMDRLTRALERSRRRGNYNFALLFVDLDRFKIINDSLGHNVGDALLIEVSRRLEESVRELDTVSRFGGDEFIVLLEELQSPRMAIQVVKRMRRRLRRPYNLGGHEIQVSASLGIVLGPVQAERAEDVLRYSNLAMHRAKAAGRDRFKVFSNRLLEHAVQLMTLENDMDTAMAEGQFFLNFQPIVQVHGEQKLFAFEALARWRHPERGLIPPAEFIAVAEETGQITDLGLWVLHEACATMVRWRENIPEARDVYLSVNISGKQFAQADLIGKIRRILRQTDMPATRLKLEITETAIMQNAVQAANTLRMLKDLGVTLAVDDFGTGYSSMSYLQKLPLDHLKIDLSFVQALDAGPENVEIVKAIINLAHTLGLQVVAEGVERPEHQRTLVELGCEYFQGYLYSRPVSVEEAEQFIRGSRSFVLPG
ncbi:MAG: EAL domain-containing protein [Desulfovibrio sp.]|nr:EAL domain-containing protein [Desulfovibrio sp.]